MKKILVTGGAGFIGSNFISYLLNSQKEVTCLVNIDLLTYAANLENLACVQENTRYKFVRGNVCDKELVEKHSFANMILTR